MYIYAFIRSGSKIQITDFPGGIAGSTVQLSVQEQRTSDARTDRNHHKMLRTCSRSGGLFSKRSHVDIIIENDDAGVVAGNNRTYVFIRPIQRRGARYNPRRFIHDARQSNSDSGEFSK
ncbi:hypothetical protein D3C73_1280040 [compost metagenome]